MEFLDEETRPKLLFQSRVSSSSSSEPEAVLKINKPLVFVCVLVSSLLSVLAIFLLQSETLRFLLIWLALSLLVGPFAPISITGGDIRVGRGEVLEPTPDLDQSLESDESEKRIPNRRRKGRRSEGLGLSSPSPVVGTVINSEKSERKSGNSVCNGNGSVVEEEKDWTDEDFELLKKQISKHPVGEPRRWELITEAFRGRHGLESVIKTAKSLSEKKPGGGDSFSQFLKQRKPLDKRMDSVSEEFPVVSMDGSEAKRESGSSNWTSGEDIALLNALKAFPKDVPMRWEKIAAAVPGKSKACCMKRVTELKRDFRSSKVSTES